MNISNTKLRNVLPYKTVRQLFAYENGHLYWLKSDGTKGRRAGRFSKKHGYSDIRYQGKSYRVHNLVWVWHGNTFLPGYEVDHIDNNRNNNHIENLQLITCAENVRKQKRVQNPKGCYFYMPCRNRWKVKVATKQIGYYKTEQEAITALNTARLNYSNI
jgi:hypothetical protein